MIVSTPHREAPCTASLDNSFSRIGRALAGGNTNTLVSALFAHNSLRDLLIKRVIAIVKMNALTYVVPLSHHSFASPTPVIILILSGLITVPNWN